MKNLLNFKRLLSYSHEKQSPQRFTRFAAMLILLLTCVTHAWATVTIYVAGSMQKQNGGDWVDEKNSLNCHNWGSDGTTWPGTAMTKTDYTVDGHAVFKCDLKNDGNTHVIFNNSWQTDTWDIDATQKAYHQPTALNGYWASSIKMADALWSSDMSVDGGYIYFDNTNAQWNDTYMYVVVGHQTYVGYYRLTKLNGTKLYYVDLGSLGWGDAKYVAVVGDGSAHSTGARADACKDLTTLNHFSDANHYAFNKGTSYMITMASGDDYTPTSISYQTTGYTAYNSRQTVYKVLGSSTTTTDVGTVTVTTTKLTNNCVGARDNSEATIGTSASSAYTDAVKTATVTLTASAKTGYEFVGWATSANGSTVSTETTFTYTATAATSYYAKFREKTYTVTISNDGHGTTSPNGAQSSIGQITGIAISADPNDDYEFVNWTIESGTGSFEDATNESTTFYPTSAATIQANFRSTVTNSLTVAAGTHVGTVTGSTDPVTLGNSYAISASNFDPGYEFYNWTASPVANATFVNASSASTNVTVNNGSVMVTANARERMSTLTTSNSYNAGDPRYAIPTKSASSIGISTTATLTATTPSTGYTFAGWTLSDNIVVTGGDKDNDLSITVRTNGNGAEATAQANYEEVLTSTYYLVGNNTSVFPGDATWAASDSKNMLRKASGSSTGSVGSITINVKSIPANSSDYQFKIHESSANKWWGWSNENYYWMDATKTTSLYDNQHNLYFIPNALGDYTFSVDWSNANEPSLTVTFPATTYTVNFGYREGGSSVTATYGGTSFASGTKVQSGKSVTFTYTKASGYNFAGWYNASTGGSIVSSDDSYTTTISGATTIYAAFTPITYNSGVLKKNGGSEDGSYTVTYNATSITPSAPTKTGYHVDGYYAEAGTSTHIATAAGVLQNNKSGYTDATGHWNYAGVKDLYAKWAANTYTAENNIDGNGGSNGKYTATYDATSIAINTAPTRTGYNLTGYHAWGREANTLANTAGALSANQSENGGGKTLTNSGSQWIYDGTDATIYADWSPKTYGITLDQEGGASGSTSVTMTYDASTHTAITNPTKTGYTFAGYWTGDNGTGSLVIATDGTLQANVDTYTGDGGIWKKDATCTLYAKWTPNNYAVTLSTTGETGYGSGAPDNQTATYGAAMPTITPPVGAAGYKFQGYFTAANGAGTKYYNANGTSAHEWDIASASTLHAYFQKAEITALEHASSVAKGETTYLVVNPTMNLFPEGYSAICWTLHYAENDNPVSEESWSVDSYTEGGTKQNQVRFTFTNLAVGSYYVKAVLKANASSFDPCSVGTELDTETGDFSVIGSSTITVRYQYLATGDMIASSGSVEIDAGGNADITAPNILGYSFNSWSLGAGVTKNSGSLTDATINISSTYDGVVTAFYTKKKMVYFNNTVGWDTVFVYFYNGAEGQQYWDNSVGAGACKNQGWGENSHKKPFWQMNYSGMKRVAPGSNIWYCDYLEIDGLSESDISANISFAKEDQACVDCSGDNTKFFYNTEAIFRGDFNPTNLPMYVPLTAPTTMRNSSTTKYYDQGYWMNYPDNSGYTLQIYDNTTDGGLRKSIQFPVAADRKMPMAITTDLEGGKTYGFKLYRADVTYYGNTGTMTNGHSGDGNQGAWEFKSDVSNRAGLTTTSAGNYTFTLTYGLDLDNTNYNYHIAVRYPESTGDFRVQYKDNVNGTWKTSVVIPAVTEVDTISYFVRKTQTPYIRVQKCTATYEDGKTTVTWDNVDGGANIISSLPSAITEDGVYNFIFTKDGDNLVLSEVEPYTGNFYIRVDGAGSTNWDNYRAADHIMPFSEYSFNQKTDKYSHYFTKYYKTLKDDGTPDESKNIKFVVANDYSTNISDTIVRDGIADTYVDANGWLSGRNANIRFMYNYKTNVATRRYLDGAQEDDSEFLLLIPSNNTSIYDVAEGGSGKTQVKFSDNGNWIYEANVYVVPGTTYKLKSSFGVGGGTTIVQYLKGAESGAGAYETLIGGSGSRLKIRLLYDFKTNRVIAAYVPSNNDEISGDNAINADIMFMREHQGDVTQITFATNESKISAIQNVYSVLKFNKTTINNLGLSRYERDLFYVSFPYNVPVSDIIGFGEYGKHWIIEYYDGAGRAEKGFWADSKSFWKFVTPAMKNSFTLQAGTGYIVALDLDEMETGDDIWENTDQVELIFPGDISMISDQEVTYTMPQHQCNIGPRFEGGDDRRIKDSHWNVLGVPAYHNTTGTFANHTDEIGDKSQVWSTDGKPNYLYTWNMTDNSLSVTNASGYNYKAMHAYIVQYYGDVTFHTSTNETPASVAARTYANAPSEVQFRLEIQQNEQTIDQTFITMSDDETVSSQFVFGEDLSKEFNTNRANIYTMVTSMLDGDMTTTETAGNTLPMSEQTTVIPVGVKIAADGEYTFSIPEGTYGVGITLIDNEAGARVNLGLMDYTVTLAAGQIDDRFVLEISPVHQSPTGVELLNGENGENGVRKVLIDNILYIVKDGKVFDAQGKRVQ